MEQLPVIEQMSLDDLTTVVTKELSTHHRMLPLRPDYSVLRSHARKVARVVQARASRFGGSTLGDLVFAQKGWRGANRPLTVMTLEDAVTYRALCDHFASQLPRKFSYRGEWDDFSRALLTEQDAAYISMTDVTAYYEFVDHGLLGDELVAQTGDALAVDQLLEVLAGVMGRNLGLPQIHGSSDILGDAYIDPVRRRLRRAGTTVVTYSDDFRIGSASQGDGRRAIEACARELRGLGLAVNERKTFTFTKDEYEESLDSFGRAEAALFTEGEDPSLLPDRYGDDAEVTEAEAEEIASLDASPIAGSVDEEDVTATASDVEAEIDISPERVKAAIGAWNIWVRESEDNDTQSGTKAAITQSLLSKALPILGAAGNPAPLHGALSILNFEPALTPQLSTYLVEYSKLGKKHLREVRGCLDQIVDEDGELSDWQAVWIAHTAGQFRGSNSQRPHVLWLHKCVETGPDVVAAHAAAALGQIGRARSDVLLAGVGRIGPVWRGLALWGLTHVSQQNAIAIANNKVERLIIRGKEG
jgi:hypothetical protein